MTEVVATVTVKIPFQSLTGRADLEIEVPADTPEVWRLRTAVEIAHKNGEDLAGARLPCANLTGARLSGARLTIIRNDLWDVLLRAQPEVPGLLAALREGRVDGSTYQGDCVCLAGTIAHIRGVDYEQLGFAESSRRIERWFLAIRQGDTPGTNPVARITDEWIVEFQRLQGREDPT